MRKCLYIIAVLLITACSKQVADDLCCNLTLKLISPFEQPIIALSVDNSLPGNFIRNLNTGEEYDFPVFVNGKCEINVLKGVYVISFDGTAALPDGSGRLVRSSEFSSPNNAVTLTEDGTVELNLLIL